MDEILYKFNFGKKSLFLLGKLKYFLADKQNLVSIIIQVSERLETLSVN